MSSSTSPPPTMSPSAPCDYCSLRRVKCDRKSPCNHCSKNRQLCTYLKVRKRPGPKGPRKSTNLKLQELQRGLRGVTTTPSLSAPSLSLSPSPDILNTPVARIPLATYFHYLDLYRTKLFRIWPIVTAEQLKVQISDSTYPGYQQARALAGALCAATIAQLKLPSEEAFDGSMIVTGDAFARECLQAKGDSLYQDSVNLTLLLVSLFLHMHYANTGKITAATFALRETITFVDLLRLGDRSTADIYSTEEWQLRLRIYWVVFVTERTFCLQHNIPITLSKIDDLPVPSVEPSANGDGDDLSPDMLAGFCDLVRLFTFVEHPLVRLPQVDPAASKTAYTKEEVSSIQGGLQLHTWEGKRVQTLQKVDIQATLAWLQSLLWQHSASHYMLSSTSQESVFSPEYPYVIARDLLGYLSTVSVDSVRPHAYGMEVKLLQVASSLLDVIVYVPSVGRRLGGQRYGPLDAIVSIEDLLSQVTLGKSEILNMLRSRMAQLNLVPTTIPTIDYSEDEKDTLRLLEGASSDSGSSNGSYHNNVNDNTSINGGRSSASYSPYSSSVSGLDTKHVVYEVSEGEL